MHRQVVDSEPIGVGADRLGLVVWESNRSGGWRIWQSDLDGSDARQLTADERGRRHCCPNISPDGRSLAYLSLPSGRARYLDREAIGELRVLDLHDLTVRRVAGRARTYFEHRAVVWRADSVLSYIAEDGSVRAHQLAGGAESLLLAPLETLDRRWLVAPDGSWAASGRGALAAVIEGRLGAETLLPGCQPFFSGDSRWLYWTAGAGGPIDRLELATGKAETIIGKNDPRLPADRGYLYFPMLSADGTLFAFAASGGEHDHHRADYDIYLAESDPVTLELLSAPWSIAPHPGVDRFPDVWRSQLELARRVDRAPSEPPGWSNVWPVLQDGLLWSWSTRTAVTTDLVPEGGIAVRPGLPLALAGGRVLAADSARLMGEGLQRTNQLGLELVLTPPPVADPARFSVILAAGRGRRRENFALGQRGELLVLRMRVGPKGGGAFTEVDLGPLPGGQRVHLALSYSPGRLTIFRDGEQIAQSAELIGHFFHWRNETLVLGDRADGSADWAGTLHAVAIYDRLLSAEEMRRSRQLLAIQSAS